MLLTIDYIDIDTKYVNRGIIEFDRKNLNSKYSKKISNYLRYVYLKFYKIVNFDAYENRWGVEDEEKRLKKKTLIPVDVINNNFSESIYEINEYEVSNEWFRSHGNNFSTRFSSNNLINLDNAQKMKLAWVYEPNEDKNYIANVQANPIFFDGLIYSPNSQNQVIALNPVDGSVKWVFNVENGIAAKRGLIIFDPKHNQSIPTSVAQKQHNPRIFFTDNRKKLFCLDAYTGEVIKSFGKNGSIKIGLTPIPPVIYKDNLIIIDTQSRLKFMICLVVK